MNQVTSYAAALDAFSKGQAVRAQEYLGSHAQVQDGQEGYVFRVWAPHARQCPVMGDFNGWWIREHPDDASWRAAYGRRLSPGLTLRCL